MIMYLNELCEEYEMIEVEQAWLIYISYVLFYLYHFPYFRYLYSFPFRQKNNH